MRERRDNKNFIIYLLVGRRRKAFSFLKSFWYKGIIIVKLYDSAMNNLFCFLDIKFLLLGNEQIEILDLSISPTPCLSPAPSFRERGWRERSKYVIYM